MGELLAEVGGLFNALTVLFGAVVFLFGHWNLQSKMISRLYRMRARGEFTDAKMIVKNAFSRVTMKTVKLDTDDSVPQPECVEL